MTKDELLVPIELAARFHALELDLSGLAIKALPPEIGMLANLQRLDLNRNRLTVLPPEIAVLANLQTLNIEGNELTLLLPEIEKLTKLETLNLEGNLLKALPPQIGRLANLVWLALGDNQLTVLPSEIGNLAKLQKLLLHGNRLTELPPQIGNLGSLQRLNVDRNRLAAIPPEIGELSDLQWLVLEGNQLSALPPEVRNLYKLRGLTLDGNQLTILPPEIAELANLELLSLAGNQLTVLPPEVGKLWKLQRLRLEGNHIASLPPEIGNLSNLKHLDVENNQLTRCPGEITKLTQLESLGLGHNELSSVPEDIGTLLELEELTLDHNDISALPSGIGNLCNLRDLDLHENQLSELPPEIGRLAKLQKLALSGNQLRALPPKMRDLTNLTWVNLGGNPLKELPPEILAKHDQPFVILTYYFEHAGKAVRPLNEAKMVLVGQPAVGKSSLVDRLVHDTHDPQKRTTEGIDIVEWELPTSEDEIRLNVWDFGGQEIMHATHQFFLTKRTLYLLVLDCRLDEPQNRIEYWLKIIHSFAGDSPVIIVGNKCDQKDLDIDEVGLRKKHPSIRAICRTACPDTALGIDDLKAAIREQIESLPHVRAEFRTTWFAVKERLERMARNYITCEEYTQICQEEAVTDEPSQTTLIGFLNDLGIALHYGDHPLLEDKNILNPEWVTRGVYAILTARELKNNKGVLFRTMLPSLLQAVEGFRYPKGTDRFLTGMMEKFELCFSFEGSNYQRFLVPDVLPKTELETGDWDGALTFKYHYDVLPHSVFSRLMVRMHPYIVPDGCWRTGVLLADDRNEALVKADLEDNKITIAVRDQLTTRRDFLSQIRGHLESIHASIVGIRAVGKIPIPGHPGVPPLNLDFALNLEADGEIRYKVEGPSGQVIAIDLPEILGSIIPEDARRNPEIVQLQRLQKQVSEDLKRIRKGVPDLEREISSLLQKIDSREALTQTGIAEIR